MKKNYRASTVSAYGNLATAIQLTITGNDNADRKLHYKIWI